MKCYWETDKNGFKKPKKKLWCKKCGYDAVYIEPHLSPVVDYSGSSMPPHPSNLLLYGLLGFLDYSLGCHQRIGIFTDRMETLTDKEPDA